jgi:hypothetical protein
MQRLTIANRSTLLATRTAVHDAVMHPQSRLAFHCASAGLTQNEPVIEQAKKAAMSVGHGSPAHPKRFACAGTSPFLLLSAGRGREQCGDAGRGQECASFHCCSNVQARAGVPEGKSLCKRTSNPLSTLGQKRTFAPQKVMSALPPKADIDATPSDVRFGPIADILTRESRGRRCSRSPTSDLAMRWQREAVERIFTLRLSICEAVH